MKISRPHLFFWFFSVIMGTFSSFSVSDAEVNSTNPRCQAVHPTVSPWPNNLCKRYLYYNSNGYCVKIIGNSFVYGTSKKQSEEEEGLKRFDTGIKFMEQAYGIMIRRTCLEVFIDVYCRWVFPACDRTSSTLQGQPICRETCENLMKMCDKELSMAIKFNEKQKDSSYPVYWKIMNCTDFQYRHGGQLPECYYRQSLNTETDKLPATDCYYGNGLGYRGDINMTRSGFTCQSWSSQCPHRHHHTPTKFPDLHNTSNSCRNPGGQAPDGPWCYTSNSSIRWEYCPVKKCSPPVPSKTPNSVGAFTTGPRSIYVQWSPVPLPFVHGEPRGFRIFLGKVGGLMTMQNTTGPGETHFEFDGLQPSANYSLAVLEFNENGDGPRSLPVFVKTMPKNSVGLRFQLTLKKENFTADLLNRQTSKYKALAVKVNKLISSLFPKGASNGYKIYQIKIVRFTNGSVNVEFDVTAGFNEIQSSRSLVTKALVGKIVQATSTGKLGTLPVGLLHVKGPPPGPKNLKSSNTDVTSARISWSPPAHHVSYRITNYTVQYKKAASKMSYFNAEMIHASRRWAVIKELDSATEYKIRVMSHNAYGQEPSEPITIRTNAKPNTTLILSIALPLVFLIIIVVVVSVLLWRWWEKKRRCEAAYLLERATQSALNENRYDSNVDVFSVLGINSSKAWWEIPRDGLTIENELGSGAFGVVKKGFLKMAKETEGKEGEKHEHEHEQDKDVIVVECAVKMLKSNPTERELRDLCNEINIMALVGDHPNIVSLIGACTLDGPLWLVVKFAEHGCFLDYVKEHRPVAEYENTRDQSPEYENTPEKTKSSPMTEKEKLKLAFEIAKGMAHLEKNKCVHRDLAARNILLDKNNVAMVSDFGLSRDVYESGAYDNTTGGVLPVRWMAIESLEDYTYTTQSDVWSFAVLLWEMESGGLMPYAGMSGSEIVEKLRQGYRLERPGQSSLELYSIMRECWNLEPKQRPTFSSLVTRFDKLLLAKAGYEEVIHLELKKESEPEHFYDLVDIKLKDSSGIPLESLDIMDLDSEPEREEKGTQCCEA